MIWLTTDAAVDAKKRLAGIGFVIHNTNRSIDHRVARQISYQDNHHAEFMAVLAAVEMLVTNYPAVAQETVILQTDSQIVQDSLEKRYAKHYQVETDQILRLTDQLSLLLIQLISDRTNHAAHQLARQAIYGENAIN